jgi:uncharacterized alpha/beta hydrolase family protein
MKRIFLSVTVLIAFILFFSSCYYDNEEALYPDLNQSCDTNNVTFNSTIVPLLSDYCYSCHSNATAAAAGNNIRLEDYSDVVSYAVRIQGSIKHAGSYSPMPKNGGMLKACQITQFDVWISGGMLNN